MQEEASKLLSLSECSSNLKPIYAFWAVVSYTQPNLQAGLNMSRYLFQASYTQAGVQGLLKEGGSSRREALTQTIEGLGGSLDAMYYAFGDVDLLMVVDLPDEASAVALSMFIGAAGALDVTMRVLVSPETIDEAIRKNVSYRAPGD